MGIDDVVEGVLRKHLGLSESQILFFFFVQAAGFSTKLEMVLLGHTV